MEQPSETSISKVLPQYQNFMDKHEDTFQMLEEKRKGIPPELRRHKKDDSYLYHENGQRDYENFP